jgi:plasmid stabilization system protein ParE
MERCKVVVTDAAKADIRAAARYLAVELRQPDTAEKLLDRFDAEIASLETMPQSHGLVHDDDLAGQGIRMTMVGNYLLFFTADRSVSTVTVLRVLRGRRDWISILTEQLASGS